MHNGARGRHGHGWPRWPRVGAVPYQALPLLRFFACNIRARKKVRKGEGEPGNEASTAVRSRGLYGWTEADDGLKRMWLR